MNVSSGDEYPAGVKRILAILDQNGIDFQLRSFEKPAHHADQAAGLLGSPLGAVVKSLVFKRCNDGELFLVLVSGENRADIDVLGRLVGGALRPAGSKEVHEGTGYPVGAVPPFGINGEPGVFIDEDLLAYDRVWGSAGAVNMLLGIDPETLRTLNKGHVESLKCVAPGKESKEI